MMKTGFLFGCVGLQVLMLALMGGQREWVLRNGRPIYLRTAPVDPRDVMRGDYVRLTYDISSVRREMCRGQLAEGVTNRAAVPRDTRVYASLRVDGEDGVAKLVSLGLDKPVDGLFLRGRTDPSSLDQLRVRYGLEAWFLEQGRGIEIETGRNLDGIQVPLEMKARVSSSGIAVLEGHRWCALGMGLNLDTTNTVSVAGQPKRRLVGATVRFLNASSNDLAVVDLPGGQSLALVPDSTWGENHWRWTPPPKPQSPLEPANVVVLKPGQTHSIRVSFADSRWSVSRADHEPDPKLLSEVTRDWNAGFRLEYRPPDRSACAGLPHANLIWHGQLASRRFSFGGGVD